MQQSKRRVLAPGLFTAAGTLLCLAASGATVAAVSILPLGDSITEGTAAHPFSSDDYPESAYRNEPGGPPANLASYREHLHDLLTHESCGADIDWVGTRRAGGRLPSVHQGHGGWHASFFDEVAFRDANGVHDGERELADWLPILAPDIVTLHLGTNGLGRARSASQNVDDIEGVLDDIFAANADTRVFLANVIPIAGWWGDRATELPASLPTVREEAEVLGELIGNLAAEQAAAGRDVTLVDVRSGYYVDEANAVDCPAMTGGDPNNMTMTVCVDDPTGETDSVPDGLHPGLLGDRFIAERFLAAMRSVGGVCAAGTDAPPAPDRPPVAEDPAPDEPADPSGTPEGPADEMPTIEEPAPTDPPSGAPLPDDDAAEPSAPAVGTFLDRLRNWRHGR